ncbi:MAG: hypothetical protein KAT86_00750, partial [Candidatus Latescibacteria bacterium]|nr:hypothetical protein [Candidatus Latescibacterota bacterium]
MRVLARYALVMLVLAALASGTFAQQVVDELIPEGELKWEKTLPKKILDFDIADETGDVIVATEDEIQKLDGNGNVLWRHGFSCEKFVYARTNRTGKAVVLKIYVNPGKIDLDGKTIIFDEEGNKVFEGIFDGRYYPSPNGKYMVRQRYEMLNPELPVYTIDGKSVPFQLPQELQEPEMTFLARFISDSELLMYR